VDEARVEVEHLTHVRAVSDEIGARSFDVIDDQQQP